MHVTALALVRLDLVLRRKIIRVCDAKRRHELLLLCRTRFASGRGRFDDWRRLWSDRRRLVKLLAKEIGLVGEKDVGAFDLAKVEAKRGHFIRRDRQGVDIGANVVSKGLGGFDDADKSFFFFGLEWQVLQFLLPCDELFKLRPGSVSRNLQTPITDGTGVLVVFLDLATGNL